MQLGGGTDIERAVAYCSGLITRPAKTLLVLVTDLAEGGNRARLFERLEYLVGSGVQVVCLLALSDDGAPGYDHDAARKARQLGVATFACTPRLLPEVLEAALRGDDLTRFERAR